MSSDLIQQLKACAVKLQVCAEKLQQKIKEKCNRNKDYLEVIDEATYQHHLQNYFEKQSSQLILLIS